MSAQSVAVSRAGMAVGIGITSSGSPYSYLVQGSDDTQTFDIRLTEPTDEAPTVTDLFVDVFGTVESAAATIDDGGEPSFQVLPEFWRRPLPPHYHTSGCRSSLITRFRFLFQCDKLTRIRKPCA